MFGGLDYFSYGLVFSVSNIKNARTSTTIFLNYQIKTYKKVDFALVLVSWISDI